VGRRTDPLIGWALAALGLAVAGGFALRSPALLGDIASSGRLILEVLVTGALGASILLSFGSAVRIIIGAGPWGGVALAAGTCVLGIAYTVAVFVPLFMADVLAGRPVPKDVACRSIAPVVSWWISDQAAFDRQLERSEVDNSAQMATRRAEEIEAWLERFRRLELPERLQVPARRVDAAVTELLALWEAQRFSPTGTSTAAVSSQRAAALSRIRDLSAACVDEPTSTFER